MKNELVKILFNFQGEVVKTGTVFVTEARPNEEFHTNCFALCRFWTFALILVKGFGEIFVLLNSPF
jgi:hypothetical protein